MANITSKPEDTTPASDDWIYSVDISDTTDNANGSDKKVTPTNLITKAHGLSDGIVKVSSGTMTQAVEDTDYQGVLTEGAFVDGDKSKLDGIEANADVTDATNVEAAGALMDSEVTSLAQIKSLYVGTVEPASPTTNDIWIDTN